MLSIIVAFDQNRGIGKEGWMPWDLPEDLRLFKQRTLHHNLIMGSTTFLGLRIPLKNRFIYVVNETPLADQENVAYITDLLAFLEKVAKEEKEYFVCGGASIYAQALPYCEKMYISHVKGDYPADTFFPDFNITDWDVIEEKDYPDFILREYQRRK